LGKRAKFREIPLMPELLERLYLYLKMRNHMEIDSEYLFVSEKGKQLSSRAVYAIVYTYLSKVTSNDKKSPHILRHTFATHMLNNGADLNLIKEILGHANLSATQIYTHNSFEQLKQIYKQAHPRA
jgi:integrase/recombinase XerC